MPSASSPSELSAITHQLESQITSNNYNPSVLSKAKIALLHQNALVPSPDTSAAILSSAQYILELGALISIRLQDPAAFTRYYLQLQPFYSLPASQQSSRNSQRSKVTGLYLLLLLSQGDYGGFHTVLESLEMVHVGLDEDPFVQYPIRLEQWLMEGSYDRVWEETKSERVPSEEFAIFSDILIGTIRAEVATCSEKAYPSIPVANAKSLLFLESEGSVVKFAKEQGWHAIDGRIYFPATDSGAAEDVLAASGRVIQNTLGYARELETIV
ncbi:MAG: regulatory particle non-ATPase [Chrysothrix sp. TS-e1954]|nr:MAG: regulatory particle non-ATPase [Chrysothrix sp. TS-e1954]